MPTIHISECLDYNAEPLEDAVVVAIDEEGFLNNIVHTEKGQDFPTSIAFLRANKTDADGQCDIYVSGANKAYVAFVHSRSDVGSDCEAHIDLTA